MKVFVAVRPPDPDNGDISNTVEGELVSMPFDRCSDDGCACNHSMVGLASGEATTTFSVVDLPHLDEALVVEAFIDGLAKQGHVDPDTAEGREAVRRYAVEHIEMAALLPEGGTYWAMHNPAA